MGVKSVRAGLFVWLVVFLSAYSAGSTSVQTNNLQIIDNPDSSGRVLGNLTNWVDTDKSHKGSGGWSVNYYDDLNGNGGHDPGEPFSDTPQFGWKAAPDNSCWLASACNMLEQIGVISSAAALYNDYALNGVSDGSGGTLTWDDGGLQEYAIAHWMNQHPGSGVTMSVHWRSFAVSYADTMFAWEDWDPRTEVDDYLDAGWEVGIGMWPLITDGTNYWHDFGHALTI